MRVVAVALFLLIGLSAVGGENSGSGRAGPIEANLELIQLAGGRADTAVLERDSSIGDAGISGALDGGERAAADLDGGDVAHVVQHSKETAANEGAAVCDGDGNCTAGVLAAGGAPALPGDSVAEGFLKKLGDLVMWPGTGVEQLEAGEQIGPSPPLSPPTWAGNESAAGEKVPPANAPDGAAGSQPHLGADADASGEVGASGAKALGENSSNGTRSENETEARGDGDVDDAAWASVIEADILPELLPGSGIEAMDAECLGVCDEDTCNGHGACHHSPGGACVCSCVRGFVGHLCEQRIAEMSHLRLRPARKPCPDKCLAQGACFRNGTCDCNKGWAGYNCGIECGGGASNPCSGHGACNKTDGKCICAEGFAGRNCTRRNVPQDVEAYRKTVTPPPPA